MDDETPEPPFTYTITNLTDGPLHLGRDHLVLPPNDPQRMTAESLRSLQVTVDELQRLVVEGRISLALSFSQAYLDGTDLLSAVGPWDVLSNGGPSTTNQNQWSEDLPPNASLHSLRREVDRLRKENTEIRSLLKQLAGTDTMVLQELLRELKRRH